MNRRLMELRDIFQKYVLPEYRGFVSNCADDGEDIIDPKAPQEAKDAWKEYCSIIQESNETGVDY